MVTLLLTLRILRMVYLSSRCGKVSESSGLITENEVYALTELVSLAIPQCSMALAALITMMIGAPCRSPDEHCSC